MSTLVGGWLRRAFRGRVSRGVDSVQSRLLYNASRDGKRDGCGVGTNSPAMPFDPTEPRGRGPEPEPVSRLHVVLAEPEIAGNVGAIGRTCVAAGARLWLVRPLGFSLDDRHRRRAGLDYWEHLDYRVVNSLAE